MTEPTGNSATCAHCQKPLTELRRTDRNQRTGWVHTNPDDMYVGGLHTAYPAAGSITEH